MAGGTPDFALSSLEKSRQHLRSATAATQCAITCIPAESLSHAAQPHSHDHGVARPSVAVHRSSIVAPDLPTLAGSCPGRSSPVIIPSVAKRHQSARGSPALESPL